MVSKPSPVKVRFTARDIKELSDCDDAVAELLRRAQSVELSFSFDDLEWAREHARPSSTAGVRMSVSKKRKTETIS